MLPRDVSKTLRATMDQHLGNCESVQNQAMANKGALRLAAVLIPFIFERVAPDLVVTKLVFVQRAVNLAHHSGEVAFPGGTYDVHRDKTLTATMFREVEEEIGVFQEQVQIWGCLPAMQSISGFCIIPLVGLISPPHLFQADNHEITEVFTVPLSYLLTPTHHVESIRIIEQNRFLLHTFPYENHKIWGVTGDLVYQLLSFFDPVTYPRSKTYPNVLDGKRDL